MRKVSWLLVLLGLTYFAPTPSAQRAGMTMEPVDRWIAESTF